MDFAGLVGRFRTNRPLSSDERQFQLHPKEPTGLQPLDQLAVIRMNSTYLEMVDKWYGEKGTITLVGIVIIAMFTAGFAALVHIAVTRDPALESAGSDIGILVFAAVLFTPLVLVAGWLLKKESFAYTHYPIRFNRKTRMVHVFRTNGSVLSVPWEKLFFTLSQVDQFYQFWNVLGHVLDEDGVTVRESFALKISGIRSGHEFLRSHWEFVRTYMEEGPDSLAGQVRFCLPIAEKKESISVGMHHFLEHMVAGAPKFWVFHVVPVLFTALNLPFRSFAIATSRIPVWPAEVDAACRIENDDPYAIEGAPNGDRVAVFPAAAAAAGVKFLSTPSTLREVPKMSYPVKGAGRKSAGKKRR
jgi:hypothetical protein